MSILSQVDLIRRWSRDEYVEQLIRYQVALTELGYQVYIQKRPVVMVFEGWDAAGKGGAIKRITEKLDPCGYVVYPIAAPEGEDKPITTYTVSGVVCLSVARSRLFDRSWYGRVMVNG